MIALSAEQELALAYCAARFREPFSILLQFDRSLGRAVQQEGSPIVGQIRLSWWRDRVAAPQGVEGSNSFIADLTRLIRDQALARESLIRMIDGWEVLLADADLPDESLIHYASARGGSLFRLAAEVSQTGVTASLKEAGILWALVDLARHCADPVLAQQAFELARPFLGSARLLARPLRPFAILARFAERDIIRGFDTLIPAGSPRRIAQAWKFSLGF